MANMKKYFVPNLSELVKNKEKFGELDKKVQSQILSFLADNKIIAQNNRLVKKATKEIKEANRITNRLKKNVTKIYPVIKNLPSGYSLSDLYVEKDRNSYRLDIRWVGLRKKCSLGTDLKEIQKICRFYNLDKKVVVNAENYKDVIRQSLSDVLNDFLIECRYENVNNATKLYFEKNELKIKLPKGVDVEKKDKLSKASHLDSNTSLSRAIGNGSGGFMKKNFSSPTTVDDTPNRVKFSKDKFNYKNRKR